jgi:molybdopterin/thiamine biosynthesis adenylyltransferase
MQAKKTKADLTDNQLLRYNRQIVLPEIDINGQNLLTNAKVVIIGLGGLGCPTATYLASSGVGTMMLLDHDDVSLSNLNRQTLFTESDIDKRKVDAAKQRLLKFNSELSIHTKYIKIDDGLNDNFLKAYDVIIDCTDNYETRTIINKVSLSNKIPLITGAALKFEGQVALFRNDLDTTPCYRCLYPDLPVTSGSCVDTGILGSVTGFVGTVLANECIKLICNFGNNLDSKLFLIDLKNNEFKTIKINKDEKCVHCE